MIKMLKDDLGQEERYGYEVRMFFSATIEMKKKQNKPSQKMAG
jgi:hypothetical protein